MLNADVATGKLCSLITEFLVGLKILTRVSIHVVHYTVKDSIFGVCKPK